MDEQSFLKTIKRLFKCDSVRVVAPVRKKFLIIGEKRRSEGVWFKNDKPFSFDYVAERCVASGWSLDDLLKSARHYKTLLKVQP